MNGTKILGLALVAAAGVATSGCSSIRDARGYIVDPVLTSAIEPGIDNKTSVAGTLGDPTFTSEYGQPTWYYVSSTTGRKPFVRPKIIQHNVMAIRFDKAGNVVSVDRTGLDKVSYIHPDGDKTPTLGRERGFLEDLFGNIGAVGAAGAPAAGQGQ
jgi:outer membrane protein assembly factor BamE (lipoprotein component of BamABCDE complex)